MAFEVVWSPAATLDLQLLLEYIAEDDLDAARRFRDKLLNHIDRLVDFPKSGRLVPEFDNELIREIVVRPYRIVYWLDTANQSVKIIRIWHAARGTPTI